MKATPMIFNGEMVRAILREIERPGSGKTQTRRIVRQDMANNFDEPRGKEDVEAGYPFVETEAGFISAVKLCPYGQRGDLIYVRETWNVFALSQDLESSWPLREIPQADPREGDGGRHSIVVDYPISGMSGTDGGKGPFRPSIHMPRWASRITLEITSVRVERLHDISGCDAVSEGYPHRRPSDLHHPIDIAGARGAAIGWFERLWDSIYSNWNDNPWVWVIEFKPHLVNVDQFIRRREAA